MGYLSGFLAKSAILVIFVLVYLLQQGSNEPWKHNLVTFFIILLVLNAVFYFFKTFSAKPGSNYLSAVSPTGNEYINWPRVWLVSIISITLLIIYLAYLWYTKERPYIN